MFGRYIILKEGHIILGVLEELLDLEQSIIGIALSLCG